MAEKLVETFKSFIKDITDVFPEYKSRLYDYYGDCKDTTKVTEFLGNIKRNYSKISEKDESLFESDPILLQNVSFKTIWNSDISVATKDSIWKYLQCFCIMQITQESSEKMEDVMKSIQMNEKVKDKKTVEQMKILKKLNESIQSKEGDMDTSTMNDINNVLGDTKIGQIAKKISEDINIEEMMGGSENPSMENLFDGDNMSKIFSAISSSVGEMGDTTDLLAEATNICGVMKDNPLFSNMLNMGEEGGGENDMMAQMMQGMMGGLMGGGGAPQPSPQPRQSLPRDTSHSGDATRERLRRKLQDKQSIPNVD